MNARLAFVALAIVSLSGCPDQETIPAPKPPAPPTVASSAPPPVASAPPPSPEDFRKTPPPSGGMVTFVPPKIVERTLGNGVRVLFVERHELPMVAVQIVVNHGADQTAPGVGAFTGAMLLSGTKKRSALAISDALGSVGAQFGSWGSYDSAGVNAKCLSVHLGTVLEILADGMRNPAFEKAEVERERSKRLTSLEQQKDSPSVVLRNAVSELLYGESHPYRLPLLGTKKALEAVTPQALAKYHGEFFTPSATTVALAGDVNEKQAMEAIEKTFGDWKGKTPTHVAVPAASPLSADAPRILLIDRPGATQSHMSLSFVGVPRKTKDFHALMVMNTILGGQFSSRLNMNLREKNAYTYGAGSGFDMRQGAGPFTAGGAIVREKTEPAAQEILLELARIRDELVSEGELADAKANLIRRLPASFETVSEIASSIAYLAIYGLPLDEFATRAAAYQAITREDVQRVAKEYLKPELYRLVIVGDANVIEKDLAKVSLGKLEVRRAPKEEPGKKASLKK